MNNRLAKSLQLGLLSIALATMAGHAIAEKPDWAGNGKNKEKNEHRKSERNYERDRDDDRYDGRHRSSIEFRFGSDDRRVVRDYYGGEARKGHCPPGLAKKNNGCLPPGQAKKWRRGYPLPADLRYYDLPYELRVRLPAPPANHRYVQVAGDILLIAVGSSMVVDAIEDIMR